MIYRKNIPAFKEPEIRLRVHTKAHLLSSPDTKYTFLPLRQQRNSALGRLTVDVSISHTIRHTYKRQESSERVISPSQKPLHYNTQQTQETNIRIFSGNRTRDPSTQAAADPCFRPHSHRDRQQVLIFQTISDPFQYYPPSSPRPLCR